MAEGNIISYKHTNFCVMPAFSTLVTVTVKVEPDHNCLRLTHNQQFGRASTHGFCTLGEGPSALGHGYDNVSPWISLQPP
jgi:hypothetical protein